MKNEYRCIIKYGKNQRCENTDTYPSNIGWICYFHMFGKQKEQESSVTPPGTLGINVSEKISAGDKVG